MDLQLENNVKSKYLIDIDSSIVIFHNVGRSKQIYRSHQVKTS